MNSDDEVDDKADDQAAGPSTNDDGSTRRYLDPDRVVTFTDGVFAIIITILVLDLEVPDETRGDLEGELAVGADGEALHERGFTLRIEGGAETSAQGCTAQHYYSECCPGR